MCHRFPGLYLKTYKAPANSIPLRVFLQYHCARPTRPCLFIVVALFVDYHIPSLVQKKSCVMTVIFELRLRVATTEYGIPDTQDVISDQIRKTLFKDQIVAISRYYK